MPKYMFTGAFTSSGDLGVEHEGGTKRRKVVADLFASLGGKLESYHFSFGADDYVVIGELPSNAAAAAASLATSATGAVHTRTIVLMTPEEIDAVAKLHPAYRAPGA
jgi:uncharacterized protein with GYD domain